VRRVFEEDGPCYHLLGQRQFSLYNSCNDALAEIGVERVFTSFSALSVLLCSLFLEENARGSSHENPSSLRERVDFGGI
jgi:hypothetical protein